MYQAQERFLSICKPRDFVWSTCLICLLSITIIPHLQKVLAFDSLSDCEFFLNIYTVKLIINSTCVFKTRNWHCHMSLGTYLLENFENDQSCSVQV